MKTALLFDFTVNKENKTIHVKREFDANLELVWKSWTTPEILDQWWAPQPFSNHTKLLDFREGGMWHYAMISSENQTHLFRFDYEKIDIEISFSGLGAFCDENGNINTVYARMHWKNNFSEETKRTTVSITISADTLETLEKII